MDARTTDRTCRDILERYRTWAVVGCSADRWRDSHDVAAALQRWGYRIVPVNPYAGDEVLGEHCYDRLTDVPGDARVEVVDLFRRSDHVGPHVDEAIAIGAKAVWMQLGVVDEDAAQRARDAGLQVVMDRCPKIEYPRLLRARSG